MIIEVRPVDAVEVFDPALTVTQDQPGVAARQAGQRARVGFQIEIGRHAAQGIRSAHDDGGLSAAEEGQAQAARAAGADY